MTTSSSDQPSESVLVQEIAAQLSVLQGHLSQLDTARQSLRDLADALRHSSSAMSGTNAALIRSAEGLRSIQSAIEAMEPRRLLQSIAALEAANQARFSQASNAERESTSRIRLQIEERSAALEATIREAENASQQSISALAEQQAKTALAARNRERWILIISAASLLMALILLIAR